MKRARSSLFRTLAQGALHLVFPGVCWTCGAALGVGLDAFCPDCRNELTGDTGPTCPRCASTVGPFANVSNGCPACRDAGHPFDRAVRLGPYDGLLREAVLRMKNADGEGLAEVMGRLWAEQRLNQLAALRAHVVVPVPLHWWRRWQRGYNQAETLARSVAAALKLPCWPRCLRRLRNTPKQALQPASARRDNVRGAFAARRGYALAGRTVLLIDDVMTTGATAAEATRALRKGGAAAVAVAVLAHGHA